MAQAPDAKALWGGADQGQLLARFQPTLVLTILPFRRFAEGSEVFAGTHLPQVGGSPVAGGDVAFITEKPVLGNEVLRIVADGKRFSGFQHYGARWDAESLFVPAIAGGQDSICYDMRPDERPREDLIKLAQLYAGRRLDDQGNLSPLPKADLRRLWEELRAKYPDDFTVRPE